MSDPEPTPDPFRVLTYTKIGAAQSHLEAAIWLWFHHKDELSIHSLAAAANEVYHAIGGKELPTIIGQFKAGLDRGERKLINAPRNFAKHAREDPDPLGTTCITPREGEAMILDCVHCHHKRFQRKTRLMDCFLMRFAAENPKFAEFGFPPDLREHFLEPGVIEEILAGTRAQFLKQALQATAEPSGASSD